MSDSAIATVPPKTDVHQLIAKVNDKKLSFDARITSVGEVMKATAHRMMAALPKHVTPDRMIRVALNAIRKNPKLLDCSAVSLFGAITEAATYGWEIGGVLGHAYLVPFNVRRGSGYVSECTLIPGYKGLIDLCRRSGQVSTISLEVVHEGDRFTYSLGDDPHIDHRPDDRNPKRDSKPITYVYAVIRLRDGGVQRSVWSREKIEAHKIAYSKAWDWAENGDKSKGGGKQDSFWHTAWPIAAKKTVIRDMIQRGLIPVSAEYRETVDRGINNEDDGSDLGTIDFVPDTPGIEQDWEQANIDDTTPVVDHDRPQTGNEPSSDLSTEANTAFLDANSISDVEAIRVSLTKKATTEADRTMLMGKAEAKANEIRASRGTRSNKS